MPAARSRPAMHILLTGASGCLGRNFIVRAPESWQVTAIYCHDASFPEFVQRSGKQNVFPVRCDLSDSADAASLFARIGSEWECCLYLACKVDVPWSVREPRRELEMNVGALLNTLHHMRCRRFIYFSSGAVYEGRRGEVGPEMNLRPTLPYAISKLTSERYVEFYCERLRTIATYMIVRFFGAYGPYEAPNKIYGKVIRSLALEDSNTFTIYGDGQNLIDAMYVEDAVEAMQLLVISDSANGILDLAGGDPVTVETLVRRMAAALGRDSIDIRKQGVAHERNLFWGSGKGMEQFCGFRPKIPLEEGVQRFLNYLQQETRVRE